MPDWLPFVAANIPLATAVTYGFLSRKVRTEGEFLDLQASYAAELKRREEQHQREVAYLEARRAEERDGRIAAERRVSSLIERVTQSNDTLGRIERELIRAAGSRGGPADAAR